MAMAGVPSWDDFVKGHLLKHSIISGILLITRHGQVIYSYGELNNFRQKDELKQFSTTFQQSHLSADTTEKKFHLSVNSNNTTHFKVYKQTYSSMYATSDGNRDGLAVCNLPYGILLCTYHLPVQSNQAMKVIEKFCEIMRA